jgi:hypothetical protein
MENSDSSLLIHCKVNSDRFVIASEAKQSRGVASLSAHPARLLRFARNDMSMVIPGIFL